MPSWAHVNAQHAVSMTPAGHKTAFQEGSATPITEDGARLNVAMNRFWYMLLVIFSTISN